MISYKFLLPLFVLALYPSLSSAESMRGEPPPLEYVKLTEENVRHFYDVSKEMHLRSYPEYASFMSAHTAEDAKITLNMTNHLPGGKEQKQTIIMDKTQFMAGLPESYNTSRGATIKHKIMGIKIAEDGKTGTVKDLSFISNRIKIRGARGMIDIEVQTQSTCDDDIIVTKGSMIKIQTSTCNAESYFFPISR